MRVDVFTCLPQLLEPVLSESLLGREHPATLSALNNLAVVFKYQGRYAEAEPLYRRVRSPLEAGTGGNPLGDPPWVEKGEIDQNGNPTPLFGLIQSIYSSTVQIAPVASAQRAAARRPNTTR